MAADAWPPSDHPSADLILRTSDGVDFRLRGAVIATASPVFDGMLSIPAATHAPDDTKDGLPICAITETSAVLRTLLRLCYPLAHPTSLTLEEVIPALAAALKYQMEDTQAMAVLKAQLVVHADNIRNTLRVYGAAICLGLEDEACAAARAALKYDVFDLSAQDPGHLAGAPASALLRLLQFVARCRRECSQMCEYTPEMDVQDYPWMDTHDISAYEPIGPYGEVWEPIAEWSVYGLQDCKCRGAVPVSFGDSRVFTWRAPKWWWKFLQSAEAALSKRPVGETVKDPHLLRNTHRNKPEDPSCDQCRIGVESVQLMQGFIEFMAKKVDERTVQIAQQTKFC